MMTKREKDTLKLMVEYIPSLKVELEKEDFKSVFIDLFNDNNVSLELVGLFFRMLQEANVHHVELDAIKNMFQFDENGKIASVELPAFIETVSKNKLKELKEFL